MGKPKAPKPPDYAAAATAQGTANTNSAIATNFLNQANQIGPTGSLTYQYDYEGGLRQPDGTVVPRATAITQLSPEQQRLYNQETYISGQLNDLASRGIGYVDQASMNPIDQSQLPWMSDGSDAGQFDLDGDFDIPAQRMTGQVAESRFRDTADPTGLRVQAPGNRLDYQQDNRGSNIPIQSRANFSDFRRQANPTNMSVQQISGPRGYQESNPGSSRTIAGQANFSNFRGQADPGSVPLNSGLGLTPGRGMENNLASSPFKFGYDFSNVEKMPKAEDFASQRDKITDAMMQRLQPFIDKDRESLRTQMANQGLGIGTEARDWEQRRQERDINDQRLAALLAGDVEQQRLFGNAMGLRQQGVQEAVAQGDMFNEAAQGTFNQGLARGDFINRAQGQDFGQRFNAAQFENAAQGQEFEQNQRRLANFNDAAGQNNNWALQQAELNNRAQGQEYSQALQDMQARNAAVGQGNADRLNFGQFNNQAQEQLFRQNQQDFENFNNATGQNNENAFRNVQIGNQAQNQQYSQALQDMQARNAARGQQNQDSLAFTEAGNRAQQQQFGQNQQAFENFNNTENNRFQQRMANAQLGNDVNNTQFAQAMGRGQFRNQAREGAFRQGLARNTFRNQARQQAIQEADYFKNQPLNMLNALRSGNQVTMPSFGNVMAGSNIAPPPVYSAAQDQYSAAMDAYKAKMANFGAVLGGVSQLGGAAITKFSDRRLKKNITKVGELPDGLGLYEYQYLWGEEVETGVMADEVAVLRPWALGPVIKGLATVNYGAL